MMRIFFKSRIFHLWRKKWHDETKSRDFDQKIQCFMQRNRQNSLRLLLKNWRRSSNILSIQKGLCQKKKADLSHKLWVRWCILLQKRKVS